MKKILTLSLIISVFAFMTNCSPKIAKTAGRTEEKTESKTPATNAPKQTGTGSVVDQAQGGRTNEEQVQLLNQTNQVRVETGAQLYGTTCAKCHELHSPGSRTASSWVEIMKSMGPKAKLEVAPYLMISSYLVKNAKG